MLDRHENPLFDADHFMAHLKHVIAISMVCLKRIPEEEQDSDSIWEEYDLNQIIADSVLNQYIENYKESSIQVRVATNEAQIGYVTFYYKGECLTPHLHYGLVTDDTELPDILTILNACISQDTANPELHRPNITE